jgi:sugar lactone lactonase YvrE
LTPVSPIKEIESIQFEEEIMKIAKYAPMLCAAVFIILVCGGNWTAAKGPPVANFPSFIPLDTPKTGDVAIDKVGNVYVNVTATNGRVQVWKFSPAGEGPDVVADFGTGIAFGLAVDPKGDIFAAMRTGPNANSLVYRVGRDGIPVQLPGTEDIVWANSLAFDQRGNLYITETYSGSSAPYGQGGIWRVPPGGEAEIWLRDDLLTGIGGTPPTGANGIGFYHGDLYVVNSLRYPKSLVVRVPIRPDGSPGHPDVWAELDEVPGTPDSLRNLYPVMGDGLALDVHGNVYVTVVTRCAVVRINAEDLSQETVATFFAPPHDPLFALLDAPNTLGFGTGKGGRQNLFVTNVGLFKAINPSFPGPGLVKIEAGVPGLPLP